MNQLTGKVAIVTGAASGIGEAIALRFAEEGAAVVAVDLAAPDSGDTREFEGGGSLTWFRADVSNADDVRAMIDVARQGWGRLNVLCNNAGITGGQSRLADLPDEMFDRVMAVNSRSVFLGMKYAIPLMIESSGGAIINIASIAAFTARAGMAAYASSKGSVMQLTRGAAVEYARDNIRVNAICPGVIQTPIPDAELTPEQKRLVAELHPVGRLGQPSEIAAMALFLAVGEVNFATGVPFIVDGGRTAQSEPPATYH